jgi:endo-1,4-beta-xylanase
MRKPFSWSRFRSLLPKRVGLIALLFYVACVPKKAAGPSDVEGTADSRESDSLRAAAAPTKRHIGVAAATWFFENPEYGRVLAREFDSLTAENEMKWYAIEPEPGRFRFEAADRLVAFAEAHGMRVRGHTLVWHSQLAPWVATLTGDALRGAMLKHTTETVAHYRGRVQQWDVVNEALDDSGKLRTDSPFSALGFEYLADAFRAARAADPKAELFYNDYDIEAPGSQKTTGAYDLVKRLKQSGVPIDGIGFQMHVDPRRFPSADEIRQNFERFAALGLRIELTEIDVPIGEIPGSENEKLRAQSEIARGVVKACLAVPACSGFTFWGLTDRHSWLSSPEWAKLRGNGPHRALLLDEHYRRKPVYDGVLAALRGR